MTDKQYDISYDTGDKVIQCGRHNDIFKLWLQWRAKGTEGFEQQQDRLMELVQYQLKRIREQSDRFHLILEPECVNVSFWYVPKRLRGVPHDAKKEVELGKVRSSLYSGIVLNTFQLSLQICPIIKGRMMQKGTLMVGYQPDDRRPNFFRSIISSAAVNEADVDFMLDEIHRLGDDL